MIQWLNFLDIGIMYIKNQVSFRPNKVKNCYFKFTDWLYISNFVVEFTLFHNTIWKKWILKHFGSCRNWSYSVLLSELYTLLHYHHYDKFEDMVVRIPVWKEYLERISLSFISKIFCSSVLYSGSTITKEQIWGKLISKKFSLFLEIRY